MRVADEQPPPGRLLELADVLTDGGLAQAQAAAGLGEVAGLGYGEKGFELHRIEHRASYYHEL
jgi:hypothetical protein